MEVMTVVLFKLPPQFHTIVFIAFFIALQDFFNVNHLIVQDVSSLPLSPYLMFNHKDKMGGVKAPVRLNVCNTI